MTFSLKFYEENDFNELSNFLFVVVYEKGQRDTASS